MKWQELLERVGAEATFTTAMLLAGERSAAGVRLQLSRWVKAGRVLSLRRGLYVLAAPWRKVEPHPFAVANRLFRGSYVSMQSALAHRGLIPEVAPTTTSVGPGRPRNLRTPLGTFRLNHVAEHLWFGYERQEVAAGQTAFVATPEKALLDLIYLTPGADSPAYLRELRLQNLDLLSPTTLRTMAERCGKPKLRRATKVLAAAMATGEEGLP